MPKLTIHTATYNRAYILENAYNSLKKQTIKDFEWIITDDGSDDGTDKLVESWMKQDNGFDIVYNKLNHVGIPRALNSGIQKANSEWFMMLDSDDYILPKTVEKVIGWLAEIEEDDEFAGVGFARCFPNGEFMKNQTPIVDEKIGYIDATHLERKKYHIDMDMCEVHRVELLKKYPFQYWHNEKYAPEQLNFYQIALENKKLRWHIEKLYICEYLPDGQTKDDRLVKNNPMGFAMMYNQNLLFEKGIKKQCINTIRMTALAIYAKNACYIFQCNAKVLAVILFPLGWALSIRRKLQFNKLK